MSRGPQRRSTRASREQQNAERQSTRATREQQNVERRSTRASGEQQNVERRSTRATREQQNVERRSTRASREQQNVERQSTQATREQQNAERGSTRATREQQNVERQSMRASREQQNVERQPTQATREQQNVERRSTQASREQQNVERRSTRATREQQAGLRLTRGADRSTQAGSGHRSQEQQDVEEGVVQPQSSTASEQASTESIAQAQAIQPAIRQATVVIYNLRSSFNRASVNQRTQAGSGHRSQEQPNVEGVLPQLPSLRATDQEIAEDSAAIRGGMATYNLRSNVNRVMANRQTQTGSGHRSQEQPIVAEGMVQLTSLTVLEGRAVLTRLRASYHLRSNVNRAIVNQQTQAGLRLEDRNNPMPNLHPLQGVARTGNYQMQSGRPHQDMGRTGNYQRTNGRPRQGMGSPGNHRITILHIQQGILRTVNDQSPNGHLQQGTSRTGNPQMANGHPLQGTARTGNPQMANGHYQQGTARTGNPQMADEHLQQGTSRTGNPQLPNGHPQQGTARTGNPQLPNGHPQQGTARRRMRLQVSSLHSSIDYKGTVLGLQCDELHATFLEVQLDGAKMRSELDFAMGSTEGSRTSNRNPVDETGMPECDTAESDDSDVSGSSIPRLPWLTSLVNFLLRLVGSLAAH